MQTLLHAFQLVFLRQIVSFYRIKHSNIEVVWKIVQFNLITIFAVKKAASARMLPLECQFLNKTALTATAGVQPQAVKHFALKRKPKSAILRAELLQKCKWKLVEDSRRCLRRDMAHARYVALSDGGHQRWSLTCFVR